VQFKNTDRVHVIVMPVREWHQMAAADIAAGFGIEGAVASTIYFGVF